MSKQRAVLAGATVSVLLLAGLSYAMAQTMPVPNLTCGSGSFEIIRGDGSIHCVPIIPGGVGSAQHLPCITCGPAVTNSTPSCEPGWTLVLAPGAMCARELKEPKR